MRCPHCAHLEDKVIDSRLVRAGRVIRRRRQCESCQSRFTTYEAVEEGTPVIVKKDGRREAYSREKLWGGLMTAIRKRPVPISDLEDAVDAMESRLFDGKSEVESEALGEEVMNLLRDTDAIAYIRFASVYKSFEDIDEFLAEIHRLIEKSR